MTTVKCNHCGAERELTYSQIKTVHLEKRTCPTCGIGTEAILIKEAKFQPLSEYVKTGEIAESTVMGTTQIRDAPSPQPQEPKGEEGPGITVGPGGSVTRRRRQATE